MATLVVSGALASRPFNAGGAWVRVSWLRGLERLGFDVFFVEQIAGEPDAAAVRWFDGVMASFGLTGSAALVDGDGGTVRGASRGELLDLASASEALVNVSGHLRWEPFLRRARKKIYLDLDPGFTQLWHASGNGGARLAGHDLHFTIGENVGRRGCPIPTDGIAWRTTRQPVVLDDWPVAKGGDPRRFTTVGVWRGPYGPVEHEGRRLGLKVHEWRRVADLPKQAAATFEAALEIHPAEGRDVALLRDRGWNLVEPRAVAGDPASFRRYVQASGAEFSVAQGVYVETGSGWFSDRTTRYLASGKPALVQETGFSRTVPAGEGLVSFRTLDEAVAGAERIVREYDAHASAARAIAEEHFDSDKVLARFLDDAGVTP